MRNGKKISGMLAAVLMASSLFCIPVYAELATELNAEKKVDKIEVGSDPEKTAYVSGEEF